MGYAPGLITEAIPIGEIHANELAAREYQERDARIKYDIYKRAVDANVECKSCSAVGIPGESCKYCHNQIAAEPK